MIRSVADRITFVGHSTVLIEIGGARLLTDPILRDRVLHIRRDAESPAAESSRDIDAVLLSHTHADHLDPPSLRRIGRDTPILIPDGARRILARRRFRNLTEMSPGDTVEIAGVQVTAVPAVHDGRRLPVGSPFQGIGFIATAEDRRVYFAGDTAPFSALADAVGVVDVALLPIAGWGPRLHVRHHLGPDTAAQAAAAIRPRIVIPIHWGTLLRIGLGSRRDEIIDRPIREFAENLAKLAPEVELRSLRPGESTDLDA
jgi:L-ascorbate metabolism protein UlaG (beta-lactamase superfamily)